MKKLFRSPIFWAVAAFFAIVAVQLPYTTSRGADWSKANDVVLSVDGPKAAITKLENNDDDIYTKLNLLKDASASTTAPTSPNVGQLWFDTSSNELKQYYASTWTAIWSYASTTDNTWEGLIDANSGTVDNFEATTITASYASVTKAIHGSTSEININGLLQGGATANQVMQWDSASSNWTPVDRQYLTAYGMLAIDSTTVSVTINTVDTWTTISPYEEGSANSSYAVLSTTDGTLTITANGLGVWKIDATVFGEPSGAGDSYALRVAVGSTLVGNCQMGNSNIAVDAVLIDNFGPITFSCIATGVASGDAFKIEVLADDGTTATFDIYQANFMATFIGPTP